MINQFLLIIILAFVIINFLCADENFDKQNAKDKINKKKVTFNLNKNKVYNLEGFNCGSQKPEEKLKPITNKSIVNKEPIFDDDVYGNNILKDSSFFIDKHTIPNYQDEFNKELGKYNKNIHENIFTNQKPYWEALNISDYTFRTYENDNINKINDFRNNQVKSENIGDIYNYLTGSNERDLTNNFSDSFNGLSSVDENTINQIYSKPLSHSDNEIFNKFEDKYYGFQNNCK